MVTNIINNRPKFEGVKDVNPYYSLVEYMLAKTEKESDSKFDKLLDEMQTKLAAFFIEKFLTISAQKLLAQDTFRIIYTKAILAGTSEAIFVGLAIFMRNLINFGKVSREDLK